MKFQAIALVTFSLLFLAACQNNPNPNAASTTSEMPEGGVTDANTQILTDFLAGRALSRQYDSSYQAVNTFVRSMKETFGSLNDADKAHILKINDNITPFTAAFDEHRRYTDQLDSLSVKISSGRISTEDALKEYAVIKPVMTAAGEKLPTTLSAINLPGLKAEFENIFSSANQKAAGGK